MIVVVSLLGLLGPGATADLVGQVSSLAPGSSANVVRTLITQAQSNRSGAGISAALGVLVSLWSASGYVAAFMRASNVVYGIGEGRPIWKTLPVSVGVTVASVVLLVISAVIGLVSGPMARQLGEVVGAGDTSVTIYSVVKWPVVVVLLSLLLAILFWASPNARQEACGGLAQG